jgi:polysaccharide biosynthesis/export protein
MSHSSHPATSPGRRRSHGSLLVLLLLAALPAAADDQRHYIVGSQDVLAITVYGQPHLSGRFAVEADGTFTFPLIGRVTVTGLTLRLVEEEVQGRLARGYLKDPQVSVAIEQYRSQQIFVMGEVRQPGSVPLTGAMTLIEALARAGSVTDRAGPEVVIVRPVPGAAAQPANEAPAGPAGEPGSEPPADSQVIRVSLPELHAGRLSQNVALRTGDMVIVSRAETVVVFGQVKSPGEYAIRNGATVMHVLALAGGVTDRGSTRRIQIIRVVRGTEITLSAGLQDPVQAGDTILVRERLF